MFLRTPAKAKYEILNKCQKQNLKLQLNNHQIYPPKSIKMDGGGQIVSTKDSKRALTPTLSRGERGTRNPCYSGGDFWGKGMGSTSMLSRWVLWIWPVGAPLHQRLLMALAFVFPLGTHYRWFPDAAFAYGKLNVYLVPEIWIGEIFVLGIILSWLWTLPKINLREQLPVWLMVALLFVAGGVSLSVSLYPGLSLILLLRIGLMVGFAFYLAQRQWDRQSLREGGWVVMAAVGLQCLLGWYQVLAGQALTTGYLARLIGESPLALDYPGINFVTVLGQYWLRPYGTFPHPNLLAALLLLALPVLGWLAWEKFQKHKKSRLILGLLIVSTLLLTLSRLAWLVLVLWLVLGIIAYSPNLRRRLPMVRQYQFWLGIGIITTLPVVLYRFVSLWGSNSFSLMGRMLLNASAVEMIWRYPLGIGMGHFGYYQRYFDTSGWFDVGVEPVHQVFLLVAVEQGWLGGVAFASMMALLTWGVIRRPRSPVRDTLFALWAFVWVGVFFDHYLWTLPQGRLFFWTIAGLSLARLPGYCRTLNEDHHAQPASQQSQAGG